MQEPEDEVEVALNLYKKASTMETEGKLSEAIQLYQKAFKLDPNVERLFQEQQEQQKQIQAFTKKTNTKNSNDNQVQNSTIEDLGKHFENLGIGREYQQILLEKTPKVKKSGLNLSSLPAEILTGCILSTLAQDDAISVEKFSMTCRYFYLLSRSPVIWKCAVASINVGAIEQTSTEISVLNYRQLFIASPRIRFDGVYISRCQYVRQGLTEWGFNQPIHFVTYYRYLRFHRDGRLLCVLSNHEPKDIVIPVIKPIQMKQSQSKPNDDKSYQLFYGNWTADLSSKTLFVVYHRTHETFHAELSLTQTSEGHWNKLKWISYFSNNSKDPDLIEYPLDHLKPFFFSRVRSLFLT